PGGGIGEDGLIGLEYPLQPGKAFLGDRLELGAGEVDRPAVHRPQDAVRDIGRPGILIEMVPTTDRHFASPVPFRVPSIYRSRVRPASCVRLIEGVAKSQRGRLSLPLLGSRFLPKLGPAFLPAR